MADEMCLTPEVRLPSVSVLGTLESALQTTVLNRSLKSVSTMEHLPRGPP